MGNLQVYLYSGTVALELALHGWGFTLTNLALEYIILKKNW